MGLNIPTKITVFRFFLIPLILITFILPQNKFKVISFILFILACISDKADGYLARKHNQVTKLGSFLDPLSDKLLLNLILIEFAVVGLLPWWMVLIVVFREVFIQILRTIADQKGKVPEAFGGKIKGPLQMFVIGLGMLFVILEGTFMISVLYHNILLGMMFLVILSALFAMVEFLFKNWRMFYDLYKQNRFREGE